MKVLIISHNPITTYNSMGRTFLGLFSSFSKEELCQLYIYPTIPNIDKCISYFRITDKEVLKSVLPWNKTGKIINKKDINYDNLLYEKENDSVLYTNKQKHKIFKLLCRSTIWNINSVCITKEDYEAVVLALAKDAMKQTVIYQELHLDYPLFFTI